MSMTLIETLKVLDLKGLFSFAAETQKKALKKSRLTGQPTPARLAFVTTLRLCTVSLGNDYEGNVNRRLVEEGKKAAFEAQGTYCHPVTPLLYKHNEKDSYYLRVYPNLCHSFLTVTKRFDAEGNEISLEEWKEIEAEFFPLPSKNESQGLENAVLVNNYSIENVKYLKQGDFVYDVLTADQRKKIAS
jgi:hypothetical protein